MRPQNDSLELAVYRIITPPWLYHALLREHTRKFGSPYKAARGILNRHREEAMNGRVYKLSTWIPNPKGYDPYNSYDGSYVVPKHRAASFKQGMAR